MKPPADVPASKLFQKLQETPAPQEEIEFPREGFGNVWVRVLSMEQVENARHLALKKLKARDLTNDGFEITKRIEGDAVAKELIAMAVFERDGSDDAPLYARVFRDARDVDALKPDEIAVLFNAYLMVQDKYGPIESNVTAEDVDAWVIRLAEGGSAFPLASISSQGLVDLTHSLSVKMYSLCQTLASQFSSLPDTLRSSLERFPLVMSLSGELADDSASTGGASSVEITLEAAKRITEALKI